MVIDNVVVEADETIFSKDELKNYVDYAKAHTDGALKKIRIKLCAYGGVDIDWKCNVPFERIRRICGYLVGTLDRWNDAKRAEESERVKHGTDFYEMQTLRQGI